MRLPEVGALFESRYRLDAILGTGGFATVYRATDTLAERTVALKVLKPEITGYPHEVHSRFQREVQVIANLRDEHTITLYDFGTSEDGYLYMVTEYVPGEDLSELLKRRGRLEPHEVVHILIQVLLSLREAHAAGLLHRDIKPQNIRVFEYAGDPLQVRLLDFGIAKSLKEEGAQITADGAIIGTLRYMSPEQLLQDELTPASDIYSLGVVAFQLLMGTEQLHGAQLTDQLARLATGHVFSIPEIERIGPDLCRVLDRMAARDVRARFANAGEVITALRATQKPVMIGSSDLVPVSPNHTPPYLAPPTTGRQTPSSLRPPVRYPSTERQSAGSTDAGFPVQPQQDTRSLWLAAAGLGVLLVAAIAAVVLLAKRQEPNEPVARTRNLPAVVRQSTTPAPEPVRAPEPKRVVIRDADAGSGEASTRSAGCGKAVTSVGFTKLRVSVDVLDHRILSAYIPTTYDPQRVYPLVVMLHENAERPPEFLGYSGMAKIAESEGAILIAPDGGYPYAWDKRVDAVAATQRAIDDARHELCVDLGRIYIVGHGMGGTEAERAPCEIPIVRNIATTSHRDEPDRRNFCEKPKHRMPYLQVSPLLDEYNPVKGGRGCSGSKKLSLAAQEQRWRDLYGCEGPRSVWHEAEGGTCYTWQCEVPYVSCHVDAGRNWDGFPGPRLYDYQGCDGPASDFPYPQTIWKFFTEFGGA